MLRLPFFSCFALLICGFCSSLKKCRVKRNAVIAWAELLFGADVADADYFDGVTPHFVSHHVVEHAAVGGALK